jgi:hypothetical protein
LVEQYFLGAQALGQQFDFVGLAGAYKQGRIRGAAFANDPGYRLHARGLRQLTYFIQSGIKIRKA